MVISTAPTPLKKNLTKQTIQNKTTPQPPPPKPKNKQTKHLKKNASIRLKELKWYTQIDKTSYDIYKKTTGLSSHIGAIAHWWTVRESYVYISNVKFYLQDSDCNSRFYYMMFGWWGEEGGGVAQGYYSIH